MSTVICTVQEAESNKLPEGRRDTHHTPKENPMFVLVLHRFSYCEEALPNITDTRSLLRFQQPPSKLIKGQLIRGHSAKIHSLNSGGPGNCWKAGACGAGASPRLAPRAQPWADCWHPRAALPSGSGGALSPERKKGRGPSPAAPARYLRPPGSPPVPAAPQPRCPTQYLRAPSLARYLRPSAPLSRRAAVTARRPYGPHSAPPDPGDAILSGPRRRDGVTLWRHLRLPGQSGAVGADVTATGRGGSVRVSSVFLSVSLCVSVGRLRRVRVPVPVAVACLCQP